VNPNIICDNFKIPFLIGAWENYFKATFVVLMKYSCNRQAVYNRALKQIRVTSEDFESISNDSTLIEWIFADSFSFQRPIRICENFKIIDDVIKLNDVFNKPLTNESKPLQERLNEILDIRNQIVHCGEVGFNITADEVVSALVDGVMRAYETICQYYSLIPEYDCLTVFPTQLDNSKFDEG